MQQVSTIFGQLLDFLPKNKFNSFVGQHNADKYVKRFTCWQQLLTLLYAQATGKESLREIETGLKVQQNKWYHLGLTSVARSTISYANNQRPYQIYENLFYALLQECKTLCKGQERDFSFSNNLYSLDGSNIDLCLSLFDWAKYQKVKGALRLHMLLDNKTLLPEFLTLTNGKVHEITETEKTWRNWNLPINSILVIDRGYIKYSLLYDFNEAGLFFVTRAKVNSNHTVVKENTTLGEGVLSDQVIQLNGEGKRSYKKLLRIVTYWDKTHQKTYKFLTNNFELSAKTIADIYRDRWQIELFFKWIKQNLKIKTFLGVSKNAVLTQIWVAMIYYLLLSYIKFKTKLKLSLLEFSRIIKEMFLERVPIISILGISMKNISICKNRGAPQQFLLF